MQTTLIKLHGAWPRVLRGHQPMSYARNWLDEHRRPWRRAERRGGTVPEVVDRAADRMRDALTDEPPLGFDTDELTDRAGSLRRRRRATLDEAAPRLIAEHLPGVSVRPSDTGMIAYDCPPNVGTVYQVNGADQRVMIYLVHARGKLDLANDRYADDKRYSLVEETSATDGALIRTYEYSETGYDPGLVVVRFGTDGMVTEAYLSGQGPLVASPAESRALAGDPDLRF